MVLCGIYKFTNKESGKVYIGQSKNIWQRYGFHYSMAAANDYQKLSSFDQALCDNPTGFDFEIVELCSEEELNNKETYWIEFYNSIEEGYNSISNKRVYQFTLDGEFVGAHLGYSEAAKSIGKPQGKGNIYHCCQGTNQTAYGYKWSYSPTLEEKTEIKSNPNSAYSTMKRAVAQYSLSGEFIKLHPSCAEAARSVGVTASAIAHVCKGRQKTSKGYIWKYNDEQWEQ